MAPVLLIAPTSLCTNRSSIGLALGPEDAPWYLNPHVFHIEHPLSRKI
jgi:hypothetical protein